MGKLNKITVRAPGSIANLGPGFDVFAIALREPSDILSAQIIPEKSVKLKVQGCGYNTIPTVPEENTAGLVALHMLEKYDINTGVRLTIEKGIKSGYGLGSSGADAAAAAYALNILLSLGLTNNELVEAAAKGELAASNAAHADNVSASLLGGFTLISSYDPLNVVRCPPPEDLGICISTPRIHTPPKKTAHARAILPKKVLLNQLTHNVGHASLLLYGILSNDISLIGKAMNDCIVEPIRSKLIPGYNIVKEGVLKRGAVGAAICGAGPSIAAFFDVKTTNPEPILESMAHGFKIYGIESDQMITQPGIGVKLVEERASAIRGSYGEAHEYVLRPKSSEEAEP